MQGERTAKNQVRRLHLLFGITFNSDQMASPKIKKAQAFPKNQHKLVITQSKKD